MITKENKSVQLTGASLEVAREVHELHNRAHAAKAALEAEYERNKRLLVEDARADMGVLWSKLLKTAGLVVDGEPEGDWEIDASYLDEHGLAFLIRKDDESESNTGLAGLLAAALRRNQTTH